MYKVHPPMPSSLSAEAQAFLLRTFEPDPHLRASAQALLEDPFLQPGKRSRSPGSPQHAPRPSGTGQVERAHWGAGEEPGADSLVPPQMPLQPALFLLLTRPPSPRHSRALRHPRNTHPAPRSAASVMGTPASSGESPGSWGGFTSSGFPSRISPLWDLGTLTTCKDGTWCPALKCSTCISLGCPLRADFSLLSL